MSSVAVLWVAASSPNPDPMITCGLLRALESSRVLSRCQNQRVNHVMRCRRGRIGSVVSSSLVAHSAGEEEKVYNVVLRQAALVNKKQLRSTTSHVLDDVKNPQDIVRFGSLTLLGEAYDRCREVCVEYAKTFYLG